MRIVLLIEDRKVAVTREETILGRGAECDIALADKSVSRNHAALVLTAHGPMLRDLGSRNGTWINGMRIGEQRRLRAGDRIRLGCATVSVVEIGGEELDRDDGWLAVQSALLLKESNSGRWAHADEILFRIAEAIETRLSIGECFGRDVCDAAFAAVVDYATLRKRPGWTRWAIGIHQKIGTDPGDATRRSLENAQADEALRSSGTVVAARPTTVRDRRTG